MAQLIKPQNVKVVTKDGELFISLQLDININLNQSGTIAVADQTISGQSNLKAKKDEDDVAWAIPDFKPTEKIKFGK